MNDDEDIQAFYKTCKELTADEWYKHAAVFCDVYTVWNDSRDVRALKKFVKLVSMFPGFKDDK